MLTWPLPPASRLRRPAERTSLRFSAPPCDRGQGQSASEADKRISSTLNARNRDRISLEGARDTNARSGMCRERWMILVRDRIDVLAGDEHVLRSASHTIARAVGVGDHAGPSLVGEDGRPQTQDQRPKTNQRRETKDQRPTPDHSLVPFRAPPTARIVRFRNRTVPVPDDWSAMVPGAVSLSS
jgi:hypothetical protein